VEQQVEENLRDGGAREIFGKSMQSSQSVSVKAKKGDVEVPLWESFSEALGTMEAYADLIDNSRTRLQILEKTISNIPRANKDIQSNIQNGFEDLRHQVKKMDEDLSLTKTTLNHQLNDVMTSIASIGRGVRELSPSLTRKLGEFDQQLCSITESLQVLRSDLDMVKNKMAGSRPTSKWNRGS
jgi:septation ring formation regulator EzrA